MKGETFYFRSDPGFAGVRIKPLQFKWLQRATTFVAIGLLVGCAKTHLYNPADHELAQKAAQSFREAELSKSANAERELLETLLADELAMLRERVAAQRDHALMALLNHPDQAGSWTKLNGLVAGRMDEICSQAQAEEILGLESDLEESENALTSEANIYRLALKAPGATGPRLVDPRKGFGRHKPDDVKPASVKAAYGAYVEALATYREEKAARDEALEGISDPESAIGKVNKRLKAAESELATIQSGQAEWAKEYREASAAYSQALKKAKDDQQALVLAVKKLREQIKKAEAPAAVKEAAAHSHELGALIEGLEARQKSVQTLLDTFIEAGEKGEPAGDASGRSEALVVASSLGALAKEIGEGLNHPRVTSLLLESEQLGLRLELAKTKVARIRTRMDLLKAQRRFLLAEWDHLATARQALADLEKDHKLPTGKKDQSLFDDFAAGSSDARILIAHALINYCNSWTLGRLPQRELGARLIAERHAASLESSVNALKQWENLIGTPLEQLVMLHGSGITTEEIAALLNAMGLTAIAIGVN